MKNLNYCLRLVTNDDMDLVYEWRNRPEVRAFMYSSAEISRKEHEKWFARMLEDHSKRWLVLNIDEKECAVIYFSEIDADRSCSWGFYSGPFAPVGVSLIVELLGLEYAFEKLGVHRLHCEVLAGNQKVINLHKKSGFVQEGCLRQARETPRGTEDVMIFGMLSNEWPASRELIQNRVENLLAKLSRPGQ